MIRTIETVAGIGTETIDGTMIGIGIAIVSEIGTEIEVTIAVIGTEMQVGQAPYNAVDTITQCDLLIRTKGGHNRGRVKRKSSYAGVDHGSAKMKETEVGITAAHEIVKEKMVEEKTPSMYENKIQVWSEGNQ